MLDFADAPYEFFPAKPSGLLIWLGRHVNRWRNLARRNHLIAGVEVAGHEHMEEARRIGGKRCFFLANHSTHSDPQILTEAQRQLGVRSCYMAAYEVFLRGKCLAWVMQHTGCFSVNRDANDGRAMKEAIRVLTEGRYGLSMFPEGNVYLMNDRVTPFLDGAAFIGMKAQKQLGKGRPIVAVPISIKATHLTDQREAIRRKLEGLARDLGTEYDRTASTVDEIKRIGLAALERALRQRGLMPRDLDEGNLRAHLEHCAKLMVVRLEEKMEMRPRSTASITERIRQIRGRIHKVRTSAETRVDHPVAVVWADEAMMGLRVLSYAGDYLDESPTLDRCGEFVEKLLEDTYSEVQPPCGDREAIVEVRPPINLADHLDAYAKGARQVVGELTAAFEASVQAGLDAICKRKAGLAGAQHF